MKGSRSMLPGLALGLVATATLADPVGGVVEGINTLTSLTYVTNLDIEPTGLTDVVLVSGTINNNDERGWDLTVTSTNAGKLQKGTTGGAGREIAYNNITFVGTGGTLGDGLNNPSTTRNIASGAGAGNVIGTTHFFTHTQFLGSGTATSATTNYTFELRITLPANTSLLSGSYTDDIELALSNDS